MDGMSRKKRREKIYAAKNRLAYLDAVRPLIQPVAEAFFAGRFDRRGAALLLPGLVARFLPTLDFRNWEKIRAWAETVFA